MCLTSILIPMLYCFGAPPVPSVESLLSNAEHMGRLASSENGDFLHFRVQWNKKLYVPKESLTLSIVGAPRLYWGEQEFYSYGDKRRLEIRSGENEAKIERHYTQVYDGAIFKYYDHIGRTGRMLQGIGPQHGKNDGYFQRQPSPFDMGMLHDNVDGWYGFSADIRAFLANVSATVDKDEQLLEGVPCVLVTKGESSVWLDKTHGYALKQFRAPAMRSSGAAWKTVRVHEYCEAAPDLYVAKKASIGWYGRRNGDTRQDEDVLLAETQYVFTDFSYSEKGDDKVFDWSFPEGAIIQDEGVASIATDGDRDSTLTSAGIKGLEERLDQILADGANRRAAARESTTTQGPTIAASSAPLPYYLGILVVCGVGSGAAYIGHAAVRRRSKP